MFGLLLAVVMGMCLVTSAELAMAIMFTKYVAGTGRVASQGFLLWCNNALAS